MTRGLLPPPLVPSPRRGLLHVRGLPRLGLCQGEGLVSLLCSYLSHLGPREHCGIMCTTTTTTTATPGEPGFLCACRLDQTQLSEEMTQMLRALQEEKPQLFICSKW